MESYKGKSGIYIIRNTVTGKFYIGSSKTNKIRWNSHKRKLINGVHDNQHLQNAWSLYGPSKFEFELIYECTPDKLLSIEDAILEKYVDYDQCYNMNKSAQAPGLRRVWSDSARKTMGDFQRGRIFSDTRCQAISKSKFGIPCSDETKAKISKSVKLANCKKNKFSENQIIEVITMYRTGTYTKRKLAEHMKCSNSYMGALLRGKKRTNLTKLTIGEPHGLSLERYSNS